MICRFPASERGTTRAAVGALALLILGSPALAQEVEKKITTVHCAIRDGERSIHVVDYEVPTSAARLLLHNLTVGNPHAKANKVGASGVFYEDDSKRTWLIVNSDMSFRRRLCSLSSLPPNGAILFPADIHFKLTNGSQVGSRIKRLVDDGRLHNTFIAFDGKDWYANIVFADGEEPDSRFTVGGYRLSAWITTSILAQEGHWVAHQSAASLEIIDSLERKNPYARPNFQNYHPIGLHRIEEAHAYGEVNWDESKYGLFPELRPVVERHLVSTDFGHTWQMQDWKILRPDVLPKGGSLVRVTCRDSKPVGKSIPQGVSVSEQIVRKVCDPGPAPGAKRGNREWVPRYFLTRAAVAMPLSFVDPPNKASDWHYLVHLKTSWLAMRIKATESPLRLEFAEFDSERILRRGELTQTPHFRLTNALYVDRHGRYLVWSFNDGEMTRFDLLDTRNSSTLTTAARKTLEEDFVLVSDARIPN